MNKHISYVASTILDPLIILDASAKIAGTTILKKPTLGTTLEPYPLSVSYSLIAWGLPVPTFVAIPIA